MAKNQGGEISRLGSLPGEVITNQTLDGELWAIVVQNRRFRQNGLVLFSVVRFLPAASLPFSFSLAYYFAWPW